MFARTFITTLFSFYLLSVGMSKVCFADASAQIKQAQAYKDNRKYDQAEAIYQQIITAFPDTNDALEAQKQLVLIYTATYRQQEADTAFEQLITEFSEHKDIAEAVWQIGQCYLEKNKHAQAFELNSYNAKNHTGIYAMWSQVEVIYYHIDRNDDSAAEAAYNKLLTDFANQPTLPKEINQIANRYNQAGRKDKALELHRYNVDNYPDYNDTHVMWSQVEVVKYYFREGDYAAVDAAVSNFLKVFSGQPTLSKGIYHIARRYDELKKYDKALELHQYNVEHFPADEPAIWSQVEIIYTHLRRADDSAADTAVGNLLTVFSEQPTLSKEIYQVARRYDELKKYDKALELHQYNVEHFPADEPAIWSQVEIIYTHLSRGDDSAVETAISNLLTVFSKHPGLPNEIYQVGMRYDQLKKYDKAIGLHQYNVEHYSSDIHALWSQVEIIKSYIRNGNEPAAEAAFDNLVTVFVDQPTLLKEVYAVADAYAKAGRYDKADKLYQYVIKKCPAEKDLSAERLADISVPLSEAKAYIALGNDANALAVIDRLIADFNNHPDLSETIFAIGEEYYNKAHNVKGDPNLPKEQAEEHYRKALTVWERIITELPISTACTPHAYYFSSVCYRHLGEYGIPIDYCQRIVDNWPDYRYIWHAKSMIRHCQKTLENSDSNP